MSSKRVIRSSGLSFRRQSRDSHPGRWVLLVALLVLIPGLLCGASAILLWRSQELMAPTLAAGRQETHGGLYGPASDVGTYAYKLERYRLTRPDILVIGSRRLSALPGEAFATTVYNAAGAAGSLDQLTSFVRAAVALHPPKSILIGLDFWWFHPDAPPAGPSVADAPNFAAHLHSPALWLLTGQVSPGHWFGGLLPASDESFSIGALAMLNGQGWDAYGRYDGPAADNDEPAGLRDVRVAPSPAALAQFTDLLAELNDKSVEVILMVPPMAASLRASLARDSENRLVPLWRDALRATGQRVFDFDDAVVLGSSDCEFVDDLTGGEVTDIRALEAIAGAGGTILSQSIDRDLVTSLIASNIGHKRLVELLPADAAPGSLYRDSDCDKAR
ncbi:MAG: hypothetical protein IPK59_05380 [Rhodospirillaceae bacterium]|nr:hypothetical protein [Rhodospirillaceae bacterium]